MKKRLVIITIVVLLLIAAIELFVRSDSFTNRIRSSVVEPIKAALGEDARIGDVKVNFIPLFLEVRDISLPDEQGAEVMAVRKVTAYINPVTLLRKELRLSYISVLEPRIFAGRTKDGAVYLIPLMERIRANIARMQSKGGARFTVAVRTLSIRKGRFVFDDEAASSKVTIDEIAVTGRFDVARQSMRAAVRNARVRYATPKYPELSGAFTAALDYRGGKIRLASAELSAEDASLSVSGDAGPWPDPSLDLRVKFKSGPVVMKKFTDLFKPERRQEPFRLEADAVITGKVSAPVIDGTLTVPVFSYAGMQVRDASLLISYRNDAVSLRGKTWKLVKGDRVVVLDELEASARVTGGRLDITALHARAEDLSIRLDGRAGLSAGMDASLSVASSGQGRALTFFTGIPLEGAIGVAGKLAGTLASPRFEGALTAGPAAARGVLFNQVRGGLEYRDKTITLSSVDIQEQSSRYVFDGAVDGRGTEPFYTARLRVLRSDVVNIVALFYRRLPLKLQAEGELSFEGTARNYSGTGFLKLKSGAAYGESFTRGSVTAKLTTGKIAFPQVILHKERGAVTGTGWIGFDGTYSADLEGRELDLSAIDRIAGQPFDGAVSMELHSSGSFSHPSVKASLEVEKLTYHRIPAGGVSASAEIRDGVLTVTSGLSGDRATLSLQGKLQQPYPWTAVARVSADELDPLLLFADRGITARVRMIADGSLTMSGRGLELPSLAGEAVFRRLSLFIGDYHLKNESSARLTITGGRISATSLNFTGQGSRISLTGWAQPLSEIDMTMTGTADLSLLKLLSREVEHTGGAAEVKLTISDDWKSPAVVGELHIRNGELKARDIPQRFTAVNGKLVFAEGRIVSDGLSAEIGGGSLNVSGWAQLEGGKLQDFTIRAAADNVTVRYPEGLVSTLSGDLYYDGDAAEQSLSGDITIKRARYDKRIEWKTMLVDIGRGLYQKRKADAGWVGDTRVNVRFHGANNIQFKNNLATMSLDVDVFLRGTVNHPHLLGRIESRRGVVYLRKNEFRILHASADFTDPARMNPVLDIQAETKVREYRIRLAVTGTAEHAQMTLISDPPLNDTDILSLLALGKKGSELIGKEAGIGVGEATSFATGSLQDFFERRARSLTGLDRFSVDPYVSKSDTSVPRVTVGKEIMQNKLYVTYSANIGSPTPEQAFRIEYLLNRHFSLVGESNDLGNTGADIKYRFEFK